MSEVLVTVYVDGLRKAGLTLTAEEVMACFRIESKPGELTLTKLRWPWLKLCLRKAYRFFIACRGHWRIWPVCVGLVRIGVTG